MSTASPIPPLVSSLHVRACQGCYELVDHERADTHCPRSAIDPALGVSGTIEITHSYENGTLLDGTSREDGRRGSLTREVLDLYSWKWARSLGCWIQRASRDKVSHRYRVLQTAERLRGLGWRVTVDLNDEPRSMAEQEAARAERMEDRADALEAKADRHATLSDAGDRAEHAILDMIPAGQPILVGHHSERRHRRDLDRAEGHRRKASEHAEVASTAADRAESAGQHMRRRYNPVTVANRIRELGADLRRMDRACGKQLRWVDGKLEPVDASPETIAHYAPHIAAARTQLEHWEQVRAEQIAAGETTEWGTHNVRIGDWVYGWGSGWYEVDKVNTVTVRIKTMRSAVDNEKWLTNLCRFTEIRKVRTAEEVEEARAAKAAREQTEAGGAS
jgi:hypothetical protein